VGGILNLSAIKKAHQNFIKLNTGALSTEMSRAKVYSEDYARRFPRFIPRSPNGLREASKAQVIRTRGGGIVRLSNAKKYAAAIDKGARPHDIHGSPLLVFFWKKHNKWVRARRVKHPGNRPYRFLYGANQASFREFGERMKAHMAQIARKF
jgi:hypothetical protein